MDILYVGEMKIFHERMFCIYISIRYKSKRANTLETARNGDQKFFQKLPNKNH